MDFHFVKRSEGNDWRLVSVLPLQIDILESREEWGGVYAALANEARTFEAQKERAQSGDAWAHDPSLFPRLQELETLVDRMSEASRDAVRLGLTTDRHRWAEDIQPFDVPLVTAAFRGDGGRSRLELYYALPTGQIARRIGVTADSVEIEIGVAVQDTAWQPVFDHARPAAFGISGDPEAASTGGLTLSVPPDSYHVAFHVRPVGSRMLGAYRFERRVPDFSLRQLAISDLVLAYRIEQRGAADAPKRSDVAIVPNPYLRFAANTPVHLYFELYNLTYGEDDLTHYTLEYTLREEGRRLLGRRENIALSLKTEREGTERSPAEFGEIDVSRVPAGRYVLEVTVTDALTARSVTGTISLEIRADAG